MKINFNSIPVFNFDSKNKDLNSSNKVSQQNYSPSLFEKYLLNRATINKVTFKGLDSTEAPLPFEETLNKYYRLKPDKYQIDAAKSIYDGHDTIVTAPTGSGKTLVAEYAIGKNLAEGKKTFYTTPLKALSNQKLNDFSKLFNTFSQKYGKENVGLITGDFEYNKEAPVIIMTTEVYRNMLLSKSQEQVTDELKNVATVIFDEFHYMNDKERGLSWEESIMFSPKHIQLLPLSATIPNAERLADWFKRINPSKEVNVICANPDDRHVPLRYFAYNEKLAPLMDEYISPDKLFTQLEEDSMGEKKKETLADLGKKLSGVQDSYEGVLALSNFSHSKSGYIKKSNFQNDLIKKGFSENEASTLSTVLVDSESRNINPSILRYNEVKKPNSKKEDTLPTIDLIRTLQNQNMIPAIFFIFSKKSCDKQVDKYIEYANKPNSPSLLTREEKEKVKNTIDEYQSKGIFLGENFNPTGLLLGVAPHHAGMLPGYRDLVEKLFQEKLVKVVFATETLAAGINMPAKTTVITNLKKPTDQESPKSSDKKDDKKNSNKLVMRYLTSTELKQMTGRAGRRGIDTIGNVIVLNYDKDMTKKAVDLIKAPPDPIKSNFKPSYNFLSFFLEHNKEMQKLNEVVERSFMFDSIKPERQQGSMQSIMKEFEAKKNVLEKRGFIEKISNESESYNVTPLGQLASKVRGVNEILLAELVYNPKLNKLSPEGLAAVISTLTQDKVINPEENSDLSKFSNYFDKYGNEFNMISNSIDSIEKLSFDIDNMQAEEGLNEPEIELDKNIAPYIFMWANECKDIEILDKEKCHDSWTRVIYALQKDRIMNYEGNFIKSINNTIDTLDQVQKLSNYMKSESTPDSKEFESYKKLEELSQDAINLLRKPPVGEVIWNHDSKIIEKTEKA